MASITSQSKPLILLVDDEPDLLEVIKIELEYQGFRVLLAKNGNQAIDVMTHESPDVILSDIRMSHGDGIFLLHHVMANRGGKPPVVFMSGYADLDEATAFEQGAVGYLHKPMDTAVLVEALRRAILPPRERWSAPDYSKPSRSLCLSCPDYEAAKRMGRLSVGRGGFFVACDPGEFEPSDLIDFEIKIGKSVQLSGAGIVRWVRSSALASGASGCGIEFISLKGASQHFVDAVLEAHPQRAFIPVR